MQADPARLGSGYVEVPVPGSHSDPVSAAALAGGSSQPARSQTPGGEEPAPAPKGSGFDAEPGRRFGCSRAAGSWNTRGGSIWNTPRICPISWPTKPRSATGAPRNRRVGVLTIPLKTRSLFGGAVRSGSKSDGTGSLGTSPLMRFPASNGTKASRPKSARCSTRSARPRSSYQGPSKAGGRQLLEYRFSSPVDGCFPFLYFAYQRYNPARTGHFFVEDPGGSVIQVDDEAVGFPADFEFAGREEHMFWDYVKIGEHSHLLPVRANFLVLYSSGTRYRVEVEYKNHRHFEASTAVTFH